MIILQFHLGRFLFPNPRFRICASNDLIVAIHVDDGLLITRDTQARDTFLQYLDQEIGIEAHINPKQYLKLEITIPMCISDRNK